MQRHHKILCTLLAAALQAAVSPAGVPLRFAADAREPRAHQEAAYRGETLDVEARLLDGGRPLALPPGAPAAIYWQTNGMAASWWSAPAEAATNGVLRATWSPTNDVGAASYRIFLGVEAGGRNWRANLSLRMLDSPGFEPNALPLPPATIDFARVEAANAPWATPADVAAATNGIRTVESDPLFSAWAGGEDGTNGLVRAGPDGSVSVGGSISLDGDISAGGGIRAEGNVSGGFVASDGNIRAEGNISAESMDIQGGAVATETYVDDRLDEMSGRIDSAAAAAAEAEVAHRIGDSNAWVEVDLYTDRLAWYSATNAVSTNGVPYVATNRIWCTDSYTQRINQRISQLDGRVSAESWAQFDAAGEYNPDDDTLLLNRAATLFGSGFSWETSGAFAVLVTSGAVGFACGTNGQVRLGLDAATNYIAIVSGGSVTVGARAGSIHMDGGLVSISYDYSGQGDYPSVYYCTSLATLEWQLANGAWTYDPESGSATFYFDATGMSRAFFKAETTRAAYNYLHSPLPAWLEGGVWGDRDAEPVKYDSTIEIQAGGHTYRIPAQLVQ